MSTGLLQDKRKIIIAVTDRKRQEYYSKLVHAHVAKAAVVHADDGLNVQQKFDNDPADVILLDVDLPKMTGIQAITQIFATARDPVAVIFLSPIPDQEHFIEEAATGRVQFLDPRDAEGRIGQCLARSLNSITAGDTLEFRLRFLAMGEQLMKKGEQAESVYILLRGNMKAWTEDESGVQVILGEIAPTEFVGEMSYISGEARSANVVATADCELIEIPILHLDRLLFDKPVWSRALMKTLAKRVKTANQRSVNA